MSLGKNVHKKSFSTLTKCLTKPEPPFVNISTQKTLQMGTFFYLSSHNTHIILFTNIQLKRLSCKAGLKKMNVTIILIITYYVFNNINIMFEVQKGLFGKCITFSHWKSDYFR